MLVVVLKDVKTRRVWCRTMCALAAVSESIKFVVSGSQLSISAINSARTSHGEIKFERDFFHDFQVDFDDVISDGYEHESVEDVLTYSFLVSSKHMVTLFKSIDVNDLEYICLKIYWGESAMASMRYKLLVEIKTKKLVMKKYQTSYQPVKRNRLLVAEDYKEKLSSKGDGITFMKLEQAIPRQFLEMIPSAVDDFKLEVRNHKVMFSGIKTAVVKERDYLKQPMAVTVILGLRDLMDTNLSPNVDESHSTSIGFRLRDFKTFMSLVSSLGPFVDESAPDVDSEEGLSMFFQRPGDPIVFELCNIAHVNIQFVQITNALTSENGKEIKFPQHMIHEYERQHSNKRHKPQTVVQSSLSHTPSTRSRISASTTPEPRIRYGAEHLPSTDQLFVGYEDDEEEKELSGSDLELGPTQNPTVKSIFD